MSNLSFAFPEKTSKERTVIAKKFYKNFTDSFVETIKLISAGTNFIQKHFTGDFSVLNSLYEKGLRCQVHLGHHFNWEYGNLTLALQVKYKVLTVYMPISSKPIDRLFKKLRSKTGIFLLPATDMRNAILPYRKEQYLLVLVADQSPANPTNSYWINFFDRPTPFLKAPESGARRGNIPVVFCHFTKEKRGYYHVHFTLAAENPMHTAPGELTKKYVAYLERAIQQQPDLWLWSHRRWKWEWKEAYGKIME
jgi:KDO2-lipid IV(A) lauroyltransferase